MSLGYRLRAKTLTGVPRPHAIIRELIQSVTIATDGGITAVVEASVLNLIHLGTNKRAPGKSLSGGRSVSDGCGGPIWPRPNYGQPFAGTLIRENRCVL